MDRCVELGIGGLNGRGLLVGESSVVLDTLESLIPDLQRFSPWISDRWRWPWSIHLVKAVNVAVIIVIVVKSDSSEERCHKLAVLLVRGVVFLAAELWGSGDSGVQLLRLDVLDAVAAAEADGHVRHIGGGGLGRTPSIEAEHWQRQGRKRRVRDRRR